MMDEVQKHDFSTIIIVFGVLIFTFLDSRGESRKAITHGRKCSHQCTLFGIFS
jgi:hypothetical protein